MTEYESSKFVEPSDLPGEWYDRRQIRFWHDEDPFAVKYFTEKATGSLLVRDPEDSEQLSYTGESVTGACRRALRLSFEAAFDSRNLYSLQVTSTAPRKWQTEASFARDVARAHEYWSSKVVVVTEEVHPKDSAPDLFLKRKQESLDAEMEDAGRVEDPVPIAALQQEILTALRAGKSFRTAHKEGGTILSFRGSSFRRTDYGEEPRTESFPTDGAILLCLRNFYDWESRRDSYPHRPPELAVWQYIQTQLRD